MLVGRRFPAGPLKPARGGLFSAAEVEKHTFDSVSWADANFGFDSATCPAKLITTDFCTAAASAVVAETDGPTDSEHWPFGIVASYECLAQNLPLEERKKIAIEQAEAGSQKAVEHELWTGVITLAAGHGDSYLNNATAIDLTVPAGGGSPVAVDIEHAIARLEQGLGDCGLGTEGIIHLTREAASLATLGGLLEWDGDALVTKLGTPVVAGTGYAPNTKNSAFEMVDDVDLQAPPVEPGPRVVWAYATGPVYVHLGPVEFISEQLDWYTNMVVTQAGRPAAVYWDSCCTLAVQVGLDLCCGDTTTDFAPGGDPADQGGDADALPDPAGTVAPGAYLGPDPGEIGWCDDTAGTQDWWDQRSYVASPQTAWVAPEQATIVSPDDHRVIGTVSWDGTDWVVSCVV